MGVALVSAGTASAQPITNLGTAVLNAGNGAVEVSGNGVTTGCIDWFNSLMGPMVCQPPGTTGSFSVQASSTAPFMVGQTGLIQDLNFNPPLPLLDFITIDLGGGVTGHFDLKDLRFNGNTAIGDCSSNAPGVTCTPANSPFQITNGLANSNGQVDSVSISLTTDLYGYTGTSGVNYNQANKYTGIFTTQGAVTGGNNIAAILATISQGGFVEASWSATLAPVITQTPEPGTYVLAGLSLISIGLVRRRMRKA